MSWSGSTGMKNQTSLCSLINHLYNHDTATLLHILIFLTTFITNYSNMPRQWALKGKARDINVTVCQVCYEALVHCGRRWQVRCWGWCQRMAYKSHWHNVVMYMDHRHWMLTFVHQTLEGMGWMNARCLDNITFVLQTGVCISSLYHNVFQKCFWKDIDILIHVHVKYAFLPMHIAM